MFVRTDGRKFDEPRKLKVEMGYLAHAEGSCLVTTASTQVLCAASLERRVPPFLVGTGQGWVTAEYSLLPRSTRQRTVRESTVGRLNGRTQEIRRFIGRSLRAAVDLFALGEKNIIVDCDVLKADGSTRVLSVIGGFLALAQALDFLRRRGEVSRIVLTDYVAAASAGMVDGRVLVDLNYEEDSRADVDMNVVMTESGKIIELQSTAERVPFSFEDFQAMYRQAAAAIQATIQMEREILSGARI